MTPTSRQIGIKLRKLRDEKGMSQVALAKKARISREHLGRLEAGRYDPSVGLVQRGISDDDIQKILGGNILRVLEQVWDH